MNFAAAIGVLAVFVLAGLVVICGALVGKK